MRADMLSEEETSKNEVSMNELPDEEMTKDKMSEEEMSLDWNELFEEEELLKNNLWEAKLYEYELSEKKMPKDKPTDDKFEEEMPKKEVPEELEVLEEEENDLSKDKLSEGKMPKDKLTKDKFKEEILKKEVPEEPEVPEEEENDMSKGNKRYKDKLGENKKVEKEEVVADEIPKNKLKEPSKNNIFDGKLSKDEVAAEDKQANAITENELMTFGLQSLNESQEEMLKEEHQVARKDESTRQRKASGVGRPRINSSNKKRIAEVGEHQDTKDLINTCGKDINQLDMNQLDSITKKDKETDKPRLEKAMDQLTIDEDCGGRTQHQEKQIRCQQIQESQDF